MSEEKQPIGQLLRQAGLITDMQLELALQDQQRLRAKQYKLGEILAIKGWIKQETVDFFVFCWQQLKMAAQIGSFQQKIGEYLYDAHLLNAAQVEEILQQQQEHKMLFGHLAVLRGYIKQETLNFFVENLFPNAAPPPPTAKDRLKKGQKYLIENNLKAAILEFRTALTLEPSNYLCHTWLSTAYLLENKVVLAKIHLNRAVEVHPHRRSN